MMDTKTLVVGQDVFIRSGSHGSWGKVVEVAPTGAIVQYDPCYGAELIRCDKSGAACDSSDISVHRYKNIILFRYEKGGAYPVPDNDLDSEYRRHFWEDFERVKDGWKDRKIPGTEDGPYKLYLNPMDAGFGGVGPCAPDDPRLMDPVLGPILKKLFKLA